MDPIDIPGPERGHDGFYRCQVCGTLMVEPRYYCPRCEPEMDAGTKERLRLVLLGLVVAAVLIGLALLR
jgi:uncharacterized OB-fold protein